MLKKIKLLDILLILAKGLTYSLAVKGARVMSAPYVEIGSYPDLLICILSVCIIYFALTLDIIEFLYHK